MQLCALITSLTLSLTACREGKESDSASSPGGHGRGGGGASARRGDGPSHGAGPPAPGAGAGPERGVPVEIAATVRHSISLYFETHGALEAENEVDLVARLAGPIVELKVEEGQRVRKGQLLARIDDREMRAALEVSEVRREETQLSYERVKRLFGSELVSQETVDQALANYQSAQGDHELHRNHGSLRWPDRQPLRKIRRAPEHQSSTVPPIGFRPSSMPHSSAGAGDPPPPPGPAGSVGSGSLARGGL